VPVPSCPSSSVAFPSPSSCSPPATSTPPLTELISGAQRSGQLRNDIGAGDIPLLFICLTSPYARTHPAFTATVRHRYLTLLLDGLRTGQGTTPLPGQPITGHDIERVYINS